MKIRTLSSLVTGLMIASTLAISACATQPLGPTVEVLPSPNKPFEVFQGDQATCKQYADQQLAGQVDQANQQGLGEAILTTALGAGLGAAVGGGRGAGIGAAAGGLVGADIGANSSGRAESRIQHQYNLAYSQCMYSKGDQVAGYRTRRYARPPPGYYPPPPEAYPPQSYPEQPYPPQSYPEQPYPPQ